MTARDDLSFSLYRVGESPEDLMLRSLVYTSSCFWYTIKLMRLWSLDNARDGCLHSFIYHAVARCAHSISLFAGEIKSAAWRKKL